MKFAKLSLAAIVVAGLTSSSFAADTLADAFKDGKMSGELKAYYFTKDNGTKDADIFTTGATLSYKTAPLYGFTLGLTAQSAASPVADDDGKAMFNSSMYGSGAVLSESYIAYSLGKTTAMVGRMYLDTPLVASSGSRVIKESFEGAAIINTDLPNTTLIAGYVQKFQSRTDKKGNTGKFTKNFTTQSGPNVDIDDGAYTLAAINKSITGLTLTAAYEYADAFLAGAVDGGVHIGYAEALYKGKAGEVGYTLGLQDYYNKIDDSKTIDNSINAYGIKAGLSYKGINGTVAFSQVSDDNVAAGAVLSGLGNGADLLYTDSSISSPGYDRDTKAYLVDVNYDINAAANVGASYVETDNSKTVSYSSLYGLYKFDGALKGLSLKAQYEDIGKDADGSNLWFKANYKF